MRTVRTSNSNLVPTNKHHLKVLALPHVATLIPFSTSILVTNRFRLSSSSIKLSLLRNDDHLSFLKIDAAEPDGHSPGVHTPFGCLTLPRPTRTLLSTLVKAQS